MIVLALMTILVVTAIVKYILHMRHWESYVKHLTIKSPVYPFFGNSLELIGKNSTDLFNVMFNYIRENDTPHKSYLGPFLVITIDRPEDFKSVLMSKYCLDKPYLYGFYPSKSSLMAATSSSVWKPIRKLMNPSFNLKTLQSFSPIFNEKIKIFIENLDKKVGKGQFNLLPLASMCTLDMISTTSMGYNVDVQRNKNREFAESLEAFFDIVAKRFIKFWAHSDFIYRWTNLYKEQTRHLTNLRNLTTHIYHIKKEEFIAENKYKLLEENESIDAYEKPQILIDRLLKMVHEGEIDEKTAIEEVETMLIGGTETSSSAVSYVILLLAMHPDIQEKVFDELRSIYKYQDEDTTSEHFPQMSYLERVIKEGLRLFPLGPFIIRLATGDVEVSNCTIPKGSYVALSIFNLHRRSDVWGASADQFDPDNFLPENVMKRHPFSFLPFAAGSRNCIGYQYGMMSLRMMLSALLRRYKFTTDLKLSELEMRFEITLKLSNGHMVGVERRAW